MSWILHHSNMQTLCMTSECTWDLKTCQKMKGKQTHCGLSQLLLQWRQGLTCQEHLQGLILAALKCLIILIVEMFMCIGKQSLIIFRMVISSATKLLILMRKETTCEYIKYIFFSASKLVIACSCSNFYLVVLICRPKEPTELTKKYAKFSKVELNKSLKLSIVSVNSEGQSVNKSEIRIPGRLQGE